MTVFSVPFLPGCDKSGISCCHLVARLMTTTDLLLAFKCCDWMKVLAASLRVGFCDEWKRALVQAIRTSSYELLRSCHRRVLKPLFYSSQKPTRKLAASAFKYCDWIKILAASLRVGFGDEWKRAFKPVFHALGEFVRANREKSNLIAWRQTLTTSPANHKKLFLCRRSSFPNSSWNSLFCVSNSLL